jgi:preprotein translocase subunit SecB
MKSNNEYKQQEQHEQDENNNKTSTQEQNTPLNQSVRLNGQYIRELHFENINSPNSFIPQKESPKIEIAVNFNNRNVGDNTYEVVLSIKAFAESMDNMDKKESKNNKNDVNDNDKENKLNLFEIKLAYAGLVTLENITEEEQKEFILNIHVPTLLFPYARSVLSEITKDAGFQPLILEPIDFNRLHQYRKEEKEKVREKGIEKDQNLEKAKQEVKN